jgi:dihydrofolate synthase / folylpolyglutamate synthase
LSIDDVIFHEWDDRRTGERRSLERARDLAARLGLPDKGTPLLAIVGSKGKGTCATFASAYLAATGLRVVTITSPGFRTHRERIRVNGRAVSGQELSGLADRLKVFMSRRAPGAGYLSPSGLFMIAGLLHARSVAADVIVVEAGRGGLADEISLFPAQVVAISPIVGEHMGELGNSLEEITRNKAGIVTAGTQAVVTSPQNPKVEALLTKIVAESAAFEIITHRSSGVPDRLLSRGLNRMNAELGCAAAQRLLDLVTDVMPERRRLAQVLDTISLPARLSSHTVPGTVTRIFVDSAVTRAATASALTIARLEFGAIDHVLLSLPDDKDLEGAVVELTGLPVTFVRLRQSHLRFTRPVPSGWPIKESADLNTDTLTQLGRRVVALGTISLTARLLDLLDAPTDQLFEV